VSRVLALTHHMARLLPWAPLAAGSVAGVGFSLVVRLFASPATPQAELITGVRLAFLPPLASLGFVLHDQHQQLAAALPVPTWVTSALRLWLGLPVTALTCSVQLWLVASGLAAGSTGNRETLPVLPLATEFAGGCAIMLAVAAAVERGRWRDLSGGAAVPVALAVLAAVCGASAVRGSPVRLLPSTFYQMTHAQTREWDEAWLAWLAAVVVAATAAAWFSRDPCRRIRRSQLPVTITPYPRQ
jgi:hypothetical protein